LQRMTGDAPAKSGRSAAGINGLKPAILEPGQQRNRRTVHGRKRTGNIETVGRACAIGAGKRKDTALDGSHRQPLVIYPSSKTACFDRCSAFAWRSNMSSDLGEGACNH
jgi:hypothetical protein